MVIKHDLSISFWGEWCFNISLLQVLVKVPKIANGALLIECSRVIDDSLEAHL